MADRPAKPDAESSISEDRRTNRLLPLGVWLSVAVLAAFFCSPADPIAMWCVLAYGLICFQAGCVFGSLDHPRAYMLPFALCGLVFTGVGVIMSGALFLGDVACFGLLSLGMGAWVSRSIQIGRFRILAFFSGGLIVGSSIGLIGTVAGALAATLLAQRKLPTTVERFSKLRPRDQ